MTTPLYCLIAFVFWSLLLLFGIAFYRIGQVLGGKAGPGSFPAGQPHGSDMYWRLNRAHANCFENIPLFASVVLVGHTSGFSSDTFDLLARIYMIGRVGQSTAHVASGSDIAINIRFVFFLTQIVCLIWMGLMLIG